MKMLILVITTIWEFSGNRQNIPLKEVVSSPNEAAIYIYNDRPSRYDVEPSQKRYNLYEVDFEAKTVVEVAIPELIFQHGNSGG